MRFVSVIQNTKSQEWGLTIQEAYIFSWLYELPSWAKRSNVSGKDYYFASRQKAISDIPLITDKPDTMYRYYVKLEQKGLIELIKIENQDFIALTNKSKAWNTSIRESENNPSDFDENDPNSENNPKELGKSSESNSENNPTYYNIKEDYNTNDYEEKKIEKKEKEKDFEFTPDLLKRMREDKNYAYKGHNFPVKCWDTLLKMTSDELTKEMRSETGQEFQDYRMAVSIVFNIKWEQEAEEEWQRDTANNT